MDGSVHACQALGAEAALILSDITHHELKDQGLNSFFIDAKDNQSLLQSGSWRLPSSLIWAAWLFPSTLNGRQQALVQEAARETGTHPGTAWAEACGGR